MSVTQSMVGWDVGGAHLKAALVERGKVVDAMQVPCTLWQGIEALDSALASMHARWPDLRTARHAVTMTGEMVDLFPDRGAGVAALVEHLGEALGPAVQFFAGSEWLDCARAKHAWQRVASVNWLATAQCLARRVDDALLIDIGSTTTDVIPIRDGRVVARGRTDAARLETSELVYQGVVRTPLCALAQRVRFRGAACNVMNEWFATSADVYRLTGELDARFDQHDAADHRGKDRPATCARLARMIGRDAREAREAEWVELARTFRDAQARLITEGAQEVLAASGLSIDAPVIAAGCGDFLVREIARRLDRTCGDIDQLLEVTGTVAHWVRTCAPSVAVALLLASLPAAQETRLACGS
ncbi:MAG TPA: hydantoinase/oxoprolinase family protein [Burkholderiaceae bacterium]|nr:hydantoinase/oxoprolinase family protein [Burkholderiaceae bacterium]